MITTKEGGKLSVREDYQKGDPEILVSREEIIYKFMDLSTPVLPEDSCKNTVERLRNLENESDVKGLLEQLRKGEQRRLKHY